MFIHELLWPIELLTNGRLFSCLVKKAIKIPKILHKFLKTAKNAPLSANMPQSCTWSTMSEMVKYRAALWSFLKLTALVFYHVWHSPWAFVGPLNFLTSGRLFSCVAKKAIESPAMLLKFSKTDKNAPLCADMLQSCTYVCMYMSFCWPIELLDKWSVLFRFGEESH